MLRARPASVAAALTILLLGVPLETAVADGGPDGGVECPATKLNCEITAEDPGTEPQDQSPKEPSGGGGEEVPCEIDGKKVPCSDPEMGTFNRSDSCYWKLLDPQPSASEVAALANGPMGSAGIPDDWEPGDPGAFYNVSCPGTLLSGGTTFSPTAPGGTSVDPAQLARKAVEQMTLRGPDIGITPKPGGRGVVGMPVYMWTETGAETYGPQAESASAGAVTVTATAKVSKIVWEMGDGKTVTCTTAGTPYKEEFGKKPSPDCGHRYTKPSSTTGSDKFHVTATSTWTIDWSGGGQSGQLTETRNSSVNITVAEVQVLN
jgi:hypothetical protein